LELTNKRNGVPLNGGKNITKKEGLQALEKYSTGLYEYITKKTSKKIEFTVCGLVGDICVINTVLQGYLMVKKVYNNSQNIKFIYSLAGTLFIGGGANGFQLKPEINDDFIKSMKLRIKYLLENETFNDDLIYYEGFTFDLLDYESNKSGSFTIKIGERISTNNKKIYKVKNISYKFNKNFNNVKNNINYNKNLKNINTKRGVMGELVKAHERYNKKLITFNETSKESSEESSE
jgi:hypothetical protein